MILYNKLSEINKKGSLSKALTPVYKIKRNNKNVQNEIKALAQENLIILKRLLDKTPNIDNQKLKKDFEKHQEYKNNICKFPTIGLNKKKKESNPTTGSLEYKNNTKTLPSIYRNTSLHSGKRKTINKLDKHYYKEAKLTKNKNNFSKKKIKKKEEYKIEEEKSIGDFGSEGSGNGSENISESGSRNGSDKVSEESKIKN